MTGIIFVEADQFTRTEWSAEIGFSCAQSTQTIQIAALFPKCACVIFDNKFD